MGFVPLFDLFCIKLFKMGGINSTGRLFVHGLFLRMFGSRLG